MACGPARRCIIPTYVYNRKAPVSAPDNDPKVAGAKSSKGDRLPAKDLQGDKVAVLPKSPKLKEGEDAQSTEASADKAAKVGTDKAAKPAPTQSRPATRCPGSRRRTASASSS